MSGRRRPRAAPRPAAERSRPVEPTHGARRVGPLVVGTLAFVVAVVVAGLVLGSDPSDLPWGAIIGVLVLLGAIWWVDRRRRP